MTMRVIATNITSIIAFLIPITLIFIYIPINHWLKSTMKRILIKSTGNKKIRFIHRSPYLLKIWFQKNPSGNLSLLVRYFFSYQQGKTFFSGQATLSNNTLIDIKYYPPGFEDPNSKLPLLSANDALIEGSQSSENSTSN